ncbi:hypothetical protein ONZ43_g7364 [Nemania bipapillata]|uniref:Uncharacterized protein n=1 Tax=Nemania bipapillata TaxID=110536 RepID=A0ACC2HSV4_9PEZI|nr:hypothetical protein ONZ43_g7364 [Nemania bipapillata]
MTAARGLLLLPDPPQRTSYSHVRTALHPTLDSVVRQLRRECEVNSLAVLDIALPVTRMGNAVRSHREFLSNVNILVFNIYRLLTTIVESLSKTRGPRFNIDARVMFVRDELEANTGEAPYSLIIATYEGLVQSTILWTHLFSVESKQGDAVYQKFYAAAMTCAVNKPALAGLCRGVERVAGGIQMYIPGAYPDGFDSLLGEAEEAGTLSDVLAVLRNEEPDQATISTNNYVLTMALLAIPAQQPGDQPLQRRLRAGSLGAKLAQNASLRAADIVASSLALVGGHAGWGGVQLSFTLAHDPIGYEDQASPEAIVVAGSADRSRLSAYEGERPVIFLRAVEAADRDVDD